MKVVRPQKAMILAAGRGERMRPLTDHTPKPLLKVGGKPLIHYHIEALVAANIRSLVINVAHLGQKIIDDLGDGRQFGAQIAYSEEPEGALETGGGIVNALSLLGEEPFMVVNGDVWIDMDFSTLGIEAAFNAHLVLVENPPQHPNGDFQLEQGLLRSSGRECKTFSGVSIYHPRFFDAAPKGVFPLAPLLREQMDKGLVSGEYYPGRWEDVGTPERLQRLDQELVGLAE